jgi:hypothetical protein
LPTVSQPDRILWSSPKSSSLLRPRAKCSTILYMSSGFCVEPAISLPYTLYNKSSFHQYDEKYKNSVCKLKVRCLYTLGKSKIVPYKSLCCSSSQQTYAKINFLCLLGTIENETHVNPQTMKKYRET